MQQALLTSIESLSAILLLTSSPLKLCHVGWGQMHFQVSPEIFYWVPAQDGAGPLKDIHRVIYKPLLLCVGCCACPVGRWTACPSEIPNALDWVFIKANLNIFVHWAFLLLWQVPQSLPLKNSPTAWGCYQHTLLLGWYSAGDKQCLLSFKHDAWNWGSSDQIILFLRV